MEEKCVLVADPTLPAGVLANTAAILGVTLGARRPDVAQGCQTYPDYLATAARTPEEAHTYLALLLWRPKRLVNRLTGSLPLLR